MIRGTFAATKNRKKHFASNARFYVGWILISTLICAAPLRSQQINDPPPTRADDLQERVQTLEAEVAQLKEVIRQLQAHDQPVAHLVNASASQVETSPAPEALTSTDRQTLDFSARHDHQPQSGWLLCLQLQPASRARKPSARLRCSKQRVQSEPGHGDFRSSS